MASTGQSLRRLSGWAPRTRTWTDSDGTTWSQPEPELDWADRALLDAWWALIDDECPVCGRPKAVHDTEVPADYSADYWECPAGIALGHARAAQSVDDERRTPPSDEVAQRINPDAPRVWYTWSRSEGPPTL